MLCVGQFQGNTFNSFNSTTADVSFRKKNIPYINLGGDLSMVEMPRGVRCDNYNSMANVDATFKRNSVDFFYLRNNTVDLNAGISLASDGASINELSSKPATDLTLQRAGVNFITLADGQTQFNQPSISNEDTIINTDKKLFVSNVLDRYITAFDGGGFAF